jgi:hypothetical protein
MITPQSCQKLLPQIRLAKNFSDIFDAAVEKNGEFSLGYTRQQEYSSRSIHIEL